MKTTAGKTKPAPRRGRVVRISSERRDLTTLRATSLRKALEAYWDETLSAYEGWHDPVYVGNTLTCTDKMGRTRVYTALEVG